MELEKQIQHTPNLNARINSVERSILWEIYNWVADKLIPPPIIAAHPDLDQSSRNLTPQYVTIYETHL